MVNEHTKQQLSSSLRETMANFKASVEAEQA